MLLQLVIGIGLTLLIFAIIACIIAVICWLLYKLFTISLVFPKVAFSLILAFILKEGNLPLVPNDTLNFAFWAIICLGSVFLLSLLPKVDWALNFVCRYIIAFFVVIILDGIFLSKFHDALWKSIVIESVIKLLCLGISLFFVRVETATETILKISNKTLIVAGRCVASFFYAIPLAMFFVSSHGNWEFADITYILLFLICVGVAYFGQVIMFGESGN